MEITVVWCMLEISTTTPELLLTEAQAKKKILLIMNTVRQVPLKEVSAP